MAAIDRNILRLGAYEMLFCPDVPTKVAINESLELAKRYSTGQSSRFVNGILDRLLAADAKAASKDEDKDQDRDQPREPSPSPSPSPGTRTRPGRRRRPREARCTSGPGAGLDPNERPKPSRTSTSPTARRPSRPIAADLHVHTTHSDGVCSPCEVVGRGRRRPVGAGDHRPRHALGHRRRPARGARLGVELIAGVELTGRSRRPRDPHPGPLRPRRRPRAASPRPARLRAARGRSARGDGRRLADAGPAGRPRRARGGPSPAPRSAAGTWPTGWCGRARWPAVARRSPATSATAARPRSPSRGSPGARRSP